MKISHCKLKKSIQKKLIEYFVLEVTARSAADLLDIHSNTAAPYYKKIRLLITHHLEQEARDIFDGKLELDKSYFGGVRKGKRGRGAGGKVVVFGLLKCGGNVYTKVIADTKTSTLLPIITDRIAPDSVVYTDSYHSYNALDVTDFHHHRMNHSKLFANGHNYIDGIENFWNQAKRVLRKYNSIPKDSFPLFLEECEFRFNYGSPKQQLKQLRKWAEI